MIRKLLLVGVSLVVMLAGLGLANPFSHHVTAQPPANGLAPRFLVDPFWPKPLPLIETPEREAGRGLSSGAGVRSSYVTHSPEAQPCGLRAGRGGPTPPERSPPSAPPRLHVRRSGNAAKLFAARCSPRTQ